MNRYGKLIEELSKLEQVAANLEVLVINLASGILERTWTTEKGEIMFVTHLSNEPFEAVLESKATPAAGVVELNHLSQQTRAIIVSELKENLESIKLEISAIYLKLDAVEELLT